MQKTIGIELAQIRRLIVAFYAVDVDHRPQACYVVQTDGPIDPASMLSRWGDAKSATHKEIPYYWAGGTAYYLPQSAGGRVLVVATVEQIRGLIESGPAPPNLGVPLAALVQSSDAARQCILIAEPQFLFGDGRRVFDGAGEQLRDPLDRFLGDDVRAMLVSFHLDDALYGELRLYGKSAGEVDVHGYHEKMRRLPGEIERWLSTLSISSYSRLLLGRFPAMLRQFAENVRAGTEDRQAVFNVYLPSKAAHNLTVATELALQEATGAGSTGKPSPADADPQSPKSVAQRLQQSITLTFPKDSLEMALKMVGDEVGVKFVILGSDLQLKGITKNQQFGLDEQNQPAEKVLRKILTLSRPDGELVYIIKPEKPGGEEIVFVTTRTAASARGEKLPATLVRPK
jgi:hypothetical protein